MLKKGMEAFELRTQDRQLKAFQKKTQKPRLKLVEVA